MILHISQKNNSKIFKTWLTDLTKIQGIVNNIKNIELWTNGATGLLNPNAVNSLVSAINGLNLQQAQLVLSTRNLTKEQMRQVLVQAGLIVSENKIQATLIQSALAQNGLSTETQKSILEKLKLIDVTTGEVIATKACTKEKLLNVLATQGVTGANAEAIISTLGLASANEKATVSFGLFTAATWSQIKAQLALMATNPLTWIILVPTVIMAAVKAYNALTTTVEEANDATKEAIQNYDSISSEVENLETKIKELNDQINGLNPITNEEDINNLKAETEELELQLAILKEKQRIADFDADKAAQESLEKTQASRYKTTTYESAYGGIEEGPLYVTQYDELQNAIEAYERYKQKVDSANQSLVEMAKQGDYSQKEWTEQNKVVETYSQKMEDARSHANKLASTILEQKAALNGNTEDSKELISVIDDVISQYNTFVDSINGVTDALNEQSDASSNIESTSSFDLSSYEETIDKIQESISTLRSALDSLNSGELSKIEVVDLMQQFPDLVPYIDLTADGFGNLSEGLSTLIEQQPDSLIQSLQDLKQSLSTDEEREQVDLLINSLQRLSSYGDTGIEAYSTSIGNTWNDTANVIENVTNQFENLAKVQEAVANGLTMSTTAAAELAKMYPEILTNAEVTANGQITLNEDVVNSILDGDKSIIDAQIAKLEADKAELTAKKTYAEAQLNIVKQVAEGEGKHIALFYSNIE